MATVNETTEIEPVLAVPIANEGTPGESDETDSLWSRYFPHDVPFLKMTLLDQLQRRPYHKVSLDGPFKRTQLAEDKPDAQTLLN